MYSKVKSATIALALGFIGPYANLVVAQLPEKPSQLKDEDMTLAELASIAKDAVVQNQEVEEEDLAVSHSQVVISNVSGQKLVRFLLSIEGNSGSVVVLDSKNGTVTSYMNSFPKPGAKAVDEDQALAAAEAFLAANEFTGVPQSTATVKYHELGNGGKRWNVSWEISAADGTPSDSAIVVIVDAVDGAVLGFQAPYDLEEDYGTINCTEAQAKDTVRDEYGPAEFDAGEVSAELRILNCARWGISRDGKHSAKVWHVTILSPPGADGRTKTLYVVDTKTGDVVLEHSVLLEED